MSDDTISETFDVPPFDEPELVRARRAVTPRPDGPELGPVDLRRIEDAVREILIAIGEDPDRDGLLDTPARVARMYAEIFSGLRESPHHHLEVQFEAHHDEMVMVRDIALTSMCEHHLVPFMGKAHVAYIPNNDGRVTGLSKLARLVDAYAKRPQVQERLTSQIADEIERTLQPKGRARGDRGRAPVHVDAGRQEAGLVHHHLRGAGPVPGQHRHPVRGHAVHQHRPVAAPSAPVGSGPRFDERLYPPAS